MQTVAVLDIGTNSVQLLIVQKSIEGKIKPIAEFGAITQLGDGLSQNGSLSSLAMERTLKALKELKRHAEDEEIKNIIVTATSAVRDASNRSLFLLECYKILGQYPQVLSGKEEAQMAFLGVATDFLPTDPLMLLDLGGGSLEIAYGTPEKLENFFSLDLGAIKITNLFNLSEKFSFNCKNAVNYILESLEEFSPAVISWLSLNTNARIVFSGGTATTFTAIEKKMTIYNRKLINKSRSTKQHLSSRLKNISKLSVAKRREIIGMEKNRAETMPGGLLIYKTILDFYDLDHFTVSVNGLRMGLGRYYLEKSET